MNPGALTEYAAMGESSRDTRVISALLVFTDPLYLDRLCRNLERDGDIFAEISLSGESALELMRYIQFEVVVAEYSSTDPDPLLLVKSMRNRSLCTPLIYSVRTEVEAEAAHADPYGPVSFVLRNPGITPQDPDPLARMIRMCRQGQETPDP
ncbi:MAG: hypothetical protein GYA23_09230 [Methanomicrobiales archaeon]|nr:hypothetical protein [Methanomicrobiales archaeon]